MSGAGGAAGPGAVAEAEPEAVRHSFIFRWLLHISFIVERCSGQRLQLLTLIVNK